MPNPNSEPISVAPHSPAALSHTCVMKVYSFLIVVVLLKFKVKCFFV